MTPFSAIGLLACRSAPNFANALWRTHSCVHRSYSPETLYPDVDTEALLWGGLTNLRPIDKSAFREALRLLAFWRSCLCGAANPGCSRLSGGSFRLAAPQSPPQETLLSGTVFRSCKRLLPSRLKQCKLAGETACATQATTVSPNVGQTLSSVSPASGRACSNPPGGPQ
jgi:hypothetical protein